MLPSVCSGIHHRLYQNNYSKNKKEAHMQLPTVGKSVTGILTIF